MIPSAAIAIFLAAVICWGLGLLAGYSLGKKQKMTKTEAARVMAKASWARRDRGQVPPSFFRTVNQ